MIHVYLTWAPTSSMSNSGGSTSNWSSFLPFCTKNWKRRIHYLLHWLLNILTTWKSNNSFLLIHTKYTLIFHICWLQKKDLTWQILYGFHPPLLLWKNRMFNITFSLTFSKKQLHSQYPAWPKCFVVAFRITDSEVVDEEDQRWIC